MKVNSLKEITFDIMYDVVQEVKGSSVSSVAAMGWSTKNIILYGVGGNERRSGVSMRNHSGSIEMLICDAKGSFIYLGKYHVALPSGFIAGEFYETFRKVYSYIETEMESIKVPL